MEGKEKVVTDASVITKWYSQESGISHALEYRQQHIEGEIELVAPVLVLYEVANALSQNPNFNERDVEESMEALLDVSLSLRPPEKETMRLAINLARKYAISVYDASYVALSMQLGCPLVTADKVLWRRVRSVRSVCLLGGE